MAWELVGESGQGNGTVANIERLLQGATAGGVPIFVSPHYDEAHDHGWHFGGTLEQRMHETKTFDRRGPLTLEGFEGSRADWLEQYKPYVRAEGTIVTSPHSCAGRGINRMVLGGCRPTSAWSPT